MPNSKDSTVCTGLSILQNYSSSSEDEEDTQKDKSTVSLNENEPQKKRKRLESPDNIPKNAPTDVTTPDDDSQRTGIKSSSASVSVTSSKSLPVPDKILGMFSNEPVDNEKENPSLHSGRIRSFPHVRGNWASFIYLPCSSSEIDTDLVFAQLETFINEASIKFKHQNNIHSVPDKHLTLSKTLSFRHHWIESFASSLQMAVKDIQSIQLILDGFEVYTNDEKTRTFIGVKVMTTASLLHLVKICDECLAEYELPPYYEDPSFHISCGWMLGDTKTWTETEVVPFLNKKFEALVDSNAEMQLHIVSKVEFKTGNKIYQFPFAKPN